MILMVLSSWHCESSPGSFNECMQTKRRLAANPQTKPIDLDCESAGNVAATISIHHRHLLLLSPKAGTHFTVPRRVEG